MSFINNLKMKNKLILLFIFPIIGIAYFLVGEVWEKSIQLKAAGDIQALSSLAAEISGVVHELQKERGLTSLYTSNRGTESAAVLSEQRTKTDKKIDDLHTFLTGFKAEQFGFEFKKILDEAMLNFNSLKERRNYANSLAASMNEIIGYYTNTIAQFLNVVSYMPRVSKDPEITTLTVAYVNLMLAKEKAGQERAIMSNTFEKDIFGKGMFRKFTSVVDSQTTYINVFLLMVPLDEKEFYKSKMQGQFIDEVEKMRNTAFEKADTGNFGVDAGHWFKVMTGKINLLKEVEGKLSADLNNKSADIKSSVQRTLVFYIIITAITIIVSSVLTYIIVRSILMPLYQMGEASKRLANGELDVSVEINSGDEIGELGKGLGQVILNLRGMIGNIRDTSDTVTNTSARIADDAREVAKGSEAQSSSIDSIGYTIEKINATMSEIARNADTLASSVEDSSFAVLELAAGITEMAENTETLFTSVDETTASIQEMSGSIKEVAGHTEAMSSSAVSVSSSVGEMNTTIKGVEANAKETTRLAERVIDDARSGMSSVEDTIAGMDKIKGLTQDSARVIEGLSGRIEKIGKILEVIQNVADETQLLSLNAAIVAAQAGAHGRGFAVVADEIKGMAEKTTSSTKEVAEIIKAIRVEGANAVKAMGDVNMGVENGVLISRKAGDALKKIVGSARSSTERIMEIAKATNEQTGAAEQIMKAAESLAQMSERIAAATQEQSRGSGHIMTAAERMKDITSTLKTSVKKQAGANIQITQTINGFVGMVGHVRQSINEQKIGASQILTAVEDVRKAARGNMEKAKETNKSIKDMNLQITALIKEVNRFKIK